MESAQVRSIEALREFRSAFLAFCQQAQEALCSVDLEGQRTLNWILRDQTGRWQRAIRDRQGELAQAKNALFRRELTKISGSHPDLIEEKKAVRRAQERLDEAQAKLKKCKEWGQTLLPKALGEFTGPARQLSEQVGGDNPPAAVFLERVLASLDAYTAAAAPRAARPAAGGRGSVSRPQPAEVPADSERADAAEAKSPAGDGAITADGSE